MQDEIRDIVNKYSGFPEWGKIEILERVPKKEKRYKCHNCFLIVDLEGDDLICPSCGSTGSFLREMCPLDHCHCGHEVVSGIAYCPMCGNAICPEDGCHSVIQISRVTGYLSSVEGWSSHKKQELKDRKRYDIAQTVKSINS